MSLFDMSFFCWYFFLYLTCYCTSAQECAQLFLFNRQKHRKMFEPTFIQIYLLIEYCFLPCNIVVSLFMLLAALIFLKSKMHNVATISAFALFFVTCIHLWTVNWLLRR